MARKERANPTVGCLSSGRLVTGFVQRRADFKQLIRRAWRATEACKCVVPEPCGAFWRSAPRQTAISRRREARRCQPQPVWVSWRRDRARARPGPGGKGAEGRRCAIQAHGRDLVECAEPVGPSEPSDGELQGQGLPNAASSVPPACCLPATAGRCRRDMRSAARHVFVREPWASPRIARVAGNWLGLCAQGRVGP